MRKPPPTELVRVRGETWEAADTQLVDRARAPTLESQMNAVLGGQAFREPTYYEVQRPVKSIRPGRKRKLMLLALLIAIVAAGGTAAVLIARRVSQSRECAALAHELEAFLRSGELREADETLDRVRVLARETGRSRELAPLMARGEATLYRYVEATRERKASVEALLALAGEGTFDAVVARALITPPKDLDEVQPVLQEIAREHGDPEAAFLSAVSLAHSHRSIDADRAFARAIDLEPANLPHLAYYACWLARSGRMKEAEEMVDQMRNVVPDSAWIEWVNAEIQNVKPLEREKPAKPERPVKRGRSR